MLSLEFWLRNDALVRQPIPASSPNSIPIITQGERTRKGKGGRERLGVVGGGKVPAPNDADENVSAYSPDAVEEQFAMTAQQKCQHVSM